MIKSIQMQNTNGYNFSDRFKGIILTLLIAVLYVFARSAPRHQSSNTIELVFIGLSVLCILLMAYDGFVRQTIVISGRYGTTVISGVKAMIVSVIYIAVIIGIFIYGWNLK